MTNIKDEAGNIITEETKRMERRRQYFQKLKEMKKINPKEKEETKEKNMEIAIITKEESDKATALN